MPYDPDLPANNSPILSAELREQFQGLRALLDDKVDNDYVESFINEHTAGSFTGRTLLNLTVSNPPTQAQVQAIANKLDEIIIAGQRV
ncbi:MAG: hypothetical protein EXS35_00605 [Pedosphaera sp.]|nr:hypothetical protein [Pedosphaera sp.]